jgi:intracellular septation protein A
MSGREIIEELKTVLSGKTLDTIVPPLVFIIINGTSGLGAGAISAVLVAMVLGIIRLLRREDWHYALIGFVIVLFASAFAYFAGNADNYVIPDIVSSVFLLSMALASLLVGLPMAAYVSHITRGWPLGWYWRKDVRPAYRDVTLFWAAYFLLRLIVQIVLFIQSDVNTFVVVEVFLGMPLTIVVLVASYVWGIHRLKVLGGPGVDEYKEGKDAPWRGQTRGF